LRSSSGQHRPLSLDNSSTLAKGIQMKKHTKKLRLTRETLQLLNGVTGGYTSIPCHQHTDLCNTNTSNPLTGSVCSNTCETGGACTVTCAGATC
jgi:hypothetical protein